jgi:hypothetical protein
MDHARVTPQFEFNHGHNYAGRPKEEADCPMRTLTAYGIGVIIVLALLNTIAWQAGMLRLHSVNVFSAGFVLGMLGTSLAAWIYGYRRTP